MTIYSIWIIGRAGGLLFQKYLTDFHPRLSANELLILASTFQSCHAISAKISPNQHCTGIETLQIDKPIPFILYCLQSPTGLKLMLTASFDASIDNCKSILKKVYELYIDYALKNPYYKLEMPIRNEVFEYHLTRSIK